jgi:hypothetical protein
MPLVHALLFAFEEAVAGCAVDMSLSFPVYSLCVIGVLVLVEVDVVGSLLLLNVDFIIISVIDFFGVGDVGLRD